MVIFYSLVVIYCKDFPLLPPFSFNFPPALVLLPFPLTPEGHVEEGGAVLSVNAACPPVGAQSLK